MDKKLLAILCCPVTHRGLTVAKSDLLKQLNAAIEAGRISNRDGKPVDDALKEALITDDGKLVYPVADGIPVLLEGESISVEQLEHA